MFLSDLGKPVAIDGPRRHLKAITEKSPILATAGEFDVAKLPSEWCGEIYSTSKILRRVEKLFENLDREEPPTFRVCEENEETEVPLPGGTVAKVTAVRINKHYAYAVMFISKVNNETAIMTNDMSPVLDRNNWSEPARLGISVRIETLYINDKVYLTRLPAAEMENAPKADHLSRLAFLIRPRHIVGLYGACLPATLRSVCAPSNLFDRQAADPEPERKPKSKGKAKTAADENGERPIVGVPVVKRKSKPKPKNKSKSKVQPQPKGKQKQKSPSAVNDMNISSETENKNSNDDTNLTVGDTGNPNGGAGSASKSVAGEDYGKSTDDYDETTKRSDSDSGLTNEDETESETETEIVQN